MKTFLVKFAGHLVGAALMVTGWWVSMLNMSIDRFSGTDYTNFWTLFGLALIFIGAYLPTWVAKWRDRKVKKDSEHKAKAEAIAAEQSANKPKGEAVPAPEGEK